MIERAPRRGPNLFLRRPIVARTNGPEREPLPRTRDPLPPRAVLLRATKTSGVVEDIGLTRADARNKMDQVKSQAHAFEENLSQWAVARSGGSEKTKLVKLPFGGVWLVPMVLAESDSNFIVGWNTWHQGYMKFYSENYGSLAIDPTKSAANDYHQAEKYEIQLGKWRADLTARGGTVTTPAAVSDKELAATKPEPFPLKTLLYVLGAGVVVYGATVVIPLVSSARSRPRSTPKKAAA